MVADATPISKISKMTGIFIFTARCYTVHFLILEGVDVTADLCTSLSVDGPFGVVDAG